MILICLMTGDPCIGRDCAGEGCEGLADGWVLYLPQSPCEACGELCDWTRGPVLCATCASNGRTTKESDPWPA